MSQENKLLSQSHQESLGPNSSMQDRNDSFLERWLHELGLIPPETALTWWGGGGECVGRCSSDCPAPRGGALSNLGARGRCTGHSTSEEVEARAREMLHQEDV